MRNLYWQHLIMRTLCLTQQQLPSIQGRANTWFAGAWTGYGFHEDGLKSGLEVAQSIAALAISVPESVAA